MNQFSLFSRITACIWVAGLLAGLLTDEVEGALRLLLYAVALLVLAPVFATLAVRGLRDETQSLARAADNRADGFRAGFPEVDAPELQELSRALDSMARRRDLYTDELEWERTRLRTLLDNMDEGVILCDATGDISLFNQVFARLFASGEKLQGRKLIEVIRIPEVVQAATRVLHDRETKVVNFEVAARSFTATMVPLPNRATGGYVAFFRDITELDRIDKVRRDFVANVSHELRTPLASVSGYAESLLEGALSDPAVSRNFVTGIARNAERLVDLIDDLLDLARIESGRYALKPERLNLHASVQAAAGMIRRIDEKGHRFQNEIAPDVEIYADPKGLSQILVNLLENAAKYCPPGTDIRATVRLERERAIVGIRDNGPGIPPADLPRIFERFYRVDKSRNAAGESGTGLGLAICRHLATEMGGDIVAESSGRGTTMWLTLPLREGITPS